MRTATDTNVFSRVVLGGSRAIQAKTLLWQCSLQGSVSVCPVVYAEMLANPMLRPDGVDDLLGSIQALVDTKLGLQVWKEAGVRYGKYAQRRRLSGGGESRRLLADFVVGAHALLQADRLLTFDIKRYEVDFPELKLVSIAA